VEKGEITLTTDWSQKDQSVNVPISYAVKINNQVLNFNSLSNPLPELYPDKYPVWIYNRPAYMEVDGGLARVRQENGQLFPLPGWLFTAFGEVSYENNTVKSFTIKMSQQVRQLKIKLSPTGTAAQKITSIQGQLTGFAGTWDFEKEIPVGNPLSIPLKFIKQSDNSWGVTVRVLGTIGNVQNLTGDISFEGQVKEVLKFNSDLTSELIQFNQEKHIPVSLSSMLETKTETGFSVTVNDWEKVQESGTAW